MSSNLPSHQETPSRPAPESSIIELIYAGNALAKYLGISPGGCLTECVCGWISSEFENPANHRGFCPVGRYYAAVEAVRRAALLG
jgi:hypothetical protein